jgi:hypothetical protein
MKYLSYLLVLGGTVLVVFGVRFRAEAQDDFGCPDGIADFPALSRHIEQADIVNGEYSFDDLFRAGGGIFTANFNTCDGQGRPATTGSGDARDPEGQPDFIRTSSPESNSCGGCHAQPIPGGTGDIVANVFVLAQAADPVVTELDPSLFDERHTLGLFGSGPIEMLAREMTADLQRIRVDAVMTAQQSGQNVTRSLDTKGVNFGFITAHPDGTVDFSGVQGVDHDLIIKPFHQAGVVVSLREFTVNAMNHHHGMQAEERFDLILDRGPDFDQDGVNRELTIGDITAVTIWEAGLPTPTQVIPDDGTMQEFVRRGEQVFAEIGCTTCHVSEMRLESRFFIEPNPYNPDGTFAATSQSFSFDMTSEGPGSRLERDGDGAIVRAFTDLKRHNLCDPEGMIDAIRFYCNEQLAQNRPDQDGRPGSEFFITRKLWDVGSSTSYGHRGDLTTVAEAILMHGGEAREIRDAFVNLSVDDQRAIVAFIRSLQIVVD